MNCRTISELCLSQSEVYTASKRVADFQGEIDLIAGGELVPRAVRVLAAIFKDYSTEGKMSKEQCMNFTARCLNSSSPRFYADQVNSVYRQHDTDLDGYLDLDNFLLFYKEAALDKAATVWGNLRNFGIHNDLRLRDEPLELNFSYLPRKVLSSREHTYQLLFQLLKHEQVAEQAFEMLQRLSISPQIYA